MLELRDLRKRYGDVTALAGLSFAVGPSSVYGFVGPNGAGKTTAMRIILGVLGADSGDVLWNGAPMDRETRRRIGYMPEERGLYPKMLVRDQLIYLARLHGLTRGEAAKGADEWLDRLGLAERSEEPLERLSLGNQQRVQLAAALVHRPELLVLDEPFSGLDPVGVEVLGSVLTEESERRQVPVLFSSHQLDLVERMCDGVAIIKDGSLIADGSLDELRRSRGGRRFRVEVTGSADGWWRDVNGVEPLGPGVFELAEASDPQDLLDRARRAGRVEVFGPDDPSLADLFRDAIATDETIAEAA